MILIDIKTSIEDEFIFRNITYQNFIALNKKGIHTIEDFINSNFDLVRDTRIRNYYKACQNVLQHKYLGLPLTNDILLDKTYLCKELQRMIFTRQNDFQSTIKKLGLNDNDFYYIKQELSSKKDNEEIKLIDILKYTYEKRKSKFSNLAQFYIEYYDNNKKFNSEVNINSLSELKQEMMQLLKLKDQLDYKVSILEKKLNSFDERNIID